MEKVGVGLPSILLEKNTKIITLLGFFTFLLIIMPMTLYCLIKGPSLNEFGVYNTNQDI